ncbi:MAG TPA: hypothetical protein VKV39_01690 [Candidatus Sulfotelmatobacter sp.]|nr:hypothetical protein [Candidatus Sulfotelmatobacter sp.]
MTAGPNLSRLRDLLAQTVGPAPWYWKTFPQLPASAGRTLGWTHHGEQGAIAHLVTLGFAEDPDQALLALNTYCRPFPVLPNSLGIWCPEGRSIRLACFDPGQLKAFELAEVAGWFKRSSDRIYALTPPIADFEVPLSLEPGTHKIAVPEAMKSLDELIVCTSYKALSNSDPAFALFVFYLQAGLVEILPQRWFTSAQYSVGSQWITRAVRDPESHRIVGECFGAGTFLLEEDGCRLAEWIERNP